MKIRQGILYLITVMTIFLALYVLEDYLIGYVLDYMNIAQWMEIVIFSVINVLINPIITYLLVKRIRFLNLKW